jgi:membrane protein implicated in regulation of membrane protease activity
MKTKNESSPPVTSSDRSCTTGSCGGPGLCPGVALFIAYAVGAGLVLLTGLYWLGWAVALPLALILLAGAWRFPSKKTG